MYVYSLARGDFSCSGGNPVPIIKYKIHISNWKKREMIERWKIIKKCFVWQTNCNLDFARVWANETWRTIRSYYNYLLQIYILTFFKLVSQFASVPGCCSCCCCCSCCYWCHRRALSRDTHTWRYTARDMQKICGIHARQGRPNNGEWLQPTELVAM